MCCPTNKVIESYTKSFQALGGLDEDKLCDILQATNVETVYQTASVLSNKAEKPRSNQFDQAQVSQSHTLYRNREN